MDSNTIRTIFKELLENLTGYNGIESLGGKSISDPNNSETAEIIAEAFKIYFENNGDNSQNNSLAKKLLEAEDVFTNYYSQNDNFNSLQDYIIQFRNSKDYNEKAFILGKIFVPELSLTDNEIIQKWKIYNTKPNPQPVKTEEVTIQLNALYSIPEEIDSTVPNKLITEWEKIKNSPLTKIADYDHPVPLFTDNSQHELIKCLDELNSDIAFEKSKGIYPSDKKFPVTVSISVTHLELDHIATDWIEHLLKCGNYENLKFYILSEKNIKFLKDTLYSNNYDIFSVFGKYAVHFNALKYFQLLLEKESGIKAGFKLDTDEGIRSEDLYNLTGKTWLETLCHPYWGGKAEDHLGNEVLLGVNEGEYINSTDIDQFGYNKAAIMPEVKMPGSFISPMATFPKGYTQAFVTELYNRFDKLEDFISHPVVKGGGYGITNEALRKGAQFTLSSVGRAEDQQFYFYGLTKNIRGIFHPKLRIAHYKASVQTSEKKQAATKFSGDMYRLLIFKHLSDLLEIKEEIDPFPGIFSGEMAKCQAWVTLLYRAFSFSADGDEVNAYYLINESLTDLSELCKEIETGKIKDSLLAEAKMWENFIKETDSLKEENVKKSLEHLTVS